MFLVCILRNPEGNFSISQPESLDVRVVNHNRTDTNLTVVGFHRR